MNHADGLAYGWWKKPLPDTLDDTRNYVLTAAEHAEYAKLLVALRAAIDAETTNVLHIARAIEKGNVRSWDEPAKPVTLVRLLSFQVALKTHELAITEFFCRATERFVQLKRENENGQP